MRAQLLASAVAAFPAAFFNTNAGSKLYVCATAQQADLDQAGFEALVWVQVKGVGNHGEVGSSTNILTYDTWDTDVVQKAKGMTDAGSPEVEVARIPTDPGQMILRAAALTNLNYAFKIVRNDANTIAGTPTVRYNRGLVTGPREPMGRNEDFDLEIFTLALQQRQVTVDPSAPGVAPALTVAPVIDDTTPTANQVINVDNGTFTGDAVITYTYQWFAAGVAISGANAAAYTVSPDHVGKVLTARVTATNAAGQAIGVTAPTTAVAA